MQIGSVTAVDRTRQLADLRAALAAAKPDRNAVRQGAAQVLSSPVMSGADFAKNQARARVQQVTDRLKILKKLYAYDPKRMAQALAQAFKELKAAVKAYAKAGGDALAAVPDAAMPAPKAEETKDQPAGEEKPQPGSALYEAVAGEARKTIAEDGLDFAKSVRELAGEIKKLLDAARNQAKARKPDKDTDEAVKEADEALKELHESLDDMEHDIHDAVPMAGMRLSVEA